MIIYILGVSIGLFKAFVLSTLWGWYIVPFDLPDINVITFFILSYMYSVIVLNSDDVMSARDRDEEDTLYILGFVFSMSLLALFFGWAGTYL